MSVGRRGEVGLYLYVGRDGTAGSLVMGQGGDGVGWGRVVMGVTQG